MQKLKSRKLFAVALAIALTLSLGATAFAAWPSFQNDSNNDGYINNGTPPITQPTNTSTIGLATNDPIGSVYSGVSSASVMDGDKVYTVYNSGVLNTATGVGGARLAITDITSGGVTYLPLDDYEADNVQQLSTPYLDTSTDTLYALTGYYHDALNSGGGISGWTNANGTPITSFNFPAGTTTIYYRNMYLGTFSQNPWGGYYELQLATDITNAGAATGSVSLTPSAGGAAINFGTSTYWSGPWTLFNQTGAFVPTAPQGTMYDLAVTITVPAGAATLSATDVHFLGSMWRLHIVDNVSSSNPQVSTVEKGYGQPNTPISFDGNSIYFGIYEGDRCYYQYTRGTSTTGSVLTWFIPQGGDDFYGAGAYCEKEYVYFGGDSSRLYKREIANFDTQGTVLNLSNVQAAAGRVRSTIAADGTHLFFTSVGTGAQGRLWKVNPVSLTSAAAPIVLPNNSTSTPAISANGYLYVGYHNLATWPGTGGVVAVNKTTFTGTPITIYSGDPVQSSPIVYTSGNWNYVYFTTNSATGAGYCYRHNTAGTQAVQAVWNAVGTSSNPYALQGFSSDRGYLVYGDDGNNLYIMR